MMTYSLVAFKKQHLESAVELFLKGYSQERMYSPYLPLQAIEDPNWIRTMLQSKLIHPGVAMVEDDHLLAYLVTGGFFDWKGQRAAMVPVYCHGAVKENEQRLYQKMYQALAQEWVKEGCHLHLIGHFAHDALLQETICQLGFGALVTERLRDCSLLDDEQGQISIKETQNVSQLVELHMAHIRYYAESPTFLARSTDWSSALDDLQAHRQNGDVFFVSYDQSEPCAYLIVGESTTGGEGFLLQNTKTAQIKSAYVRPDLRGTGIGAALLNRAIQWSQQQGYERVFVEHETANVAGGNFWSKYFTPYLHFSMRYIDNTL